MRTVFRVLILTPIVFLVFGAFVHLLWNGLMPGIFGLHMITYWQAVGLMALGWLLFGGWRGAPGYCGHMGGGHWRRRMSERWHNMSPEDREKLRQGMHTVRDRWREHREHHGRPPQEGQVIPPEAPKA
jgi:hypothetical protein